eukprot:TRINITY_DN33358_c0_g1_i1.p1 TRINITY_DN33358_c0_g1~~TRINITY_DN33358_c0_g1_i1.p1  ORF type:complete len:388 (-),score=49.02 TRINITY_DN33358_c0_g1_i1:68-1231(-)
MSVIAIISVSALVALKISRQRGETLKSRCRYLVFMTAVGDAKGIPYETQTREQIMSRLRTVPNVIYDTSVGNPFIPDGYGNGNTTDDTQLTIAMIDALHAKGKFDIEEVAKSHVQAYKETTIGWGGSKFAIEKLANSTATVFTCGSTRATGNGVIMKLAPFAMFLAQQPLEAGEDVASLRKENQEYLIALSSLTHRTPIAFITAILYCAMAEDLFRHPHYLDSAPKRALWLHKIIVWCESLETKYLHPSFLCKINHAHEDNEDPEKFAQTVSPMSPLLKGIELQLPYLASDDLVVMLTRGGTFYCANSLAMVVALLCRSPPQFTSILEAALIGGDTDSNAAMVGSILGGMKGNELDTHQLREHVTGLPELQKLRLAGDRLFAVVSQR